MSINQDSIFHTEEIGGETWGLTWQGGCEYHAKRHTDNGWVSGVWFESDIKPMTEKFIAVARNEISEKMQRAAGETEC